MVVEWKDAEQGGADAQPPGMAALLASGWQRRNNTLVRLEPVPGKKMKKLSSFRPAPMLPVPFNKEVPVKEEDLERGDPAAWRVQTALGVTANGRMRKELAHITRLRDEHRLSLSRLGHRASLNQDRSLSSDDARTWIPAARDPTALGGSNQDARPGMMSSSMAMSRGGLPSRGMGTAASRRMGTSSVPLERMLSGGRVGTSNPREGRCSR
ncbi:hypothetical protein T484DRAFT_1846495 [Baffinella frigidus]|nr:hypothetical protein T484DRAFT_1846495 [Cryptophyta sp. CCMP2293]